MEDTSDLVRQARNAAIDTMPTQKLTEDTLYWLMADAITAMEAEIAKLKQRQYLVDAPPGYDDKSEPLVRPVSPELLAMAQAIVDRGPDTRTEEQLLADGVRFIMGPGGDEGTRQRDLVAETWAKVDAAKAGDPVSAVQDQLAGRSPAPTDPVREALAAYVKAQGRMLDKWADGDANVKRDLWRNLHACEDAARAALAQEPAAKTIMCSECSETWIDGSPEKHSATCPNVEPAAPADDLVRRLPNAQA